MGFECRPSNIHKVYGMYCAEVATLDTEIEEGTHYTLINKATWSLVAKWYCKDPNKFEMCRKVVGESKSLCVSPTCFILVKQQIHKDANPLRFLDNDKILLCPNSAISKKFK